MKLYLRGLLDRYREHHDMDRPLLQWIGIVGCITFPLFYALRIATGSSGWDDLPLRAIATFLCLGLAVRRWWPAALRPHYIGYSYVAVFYCLSFLLSLSMLKNAGGTPYVLNMVMGAVLIVLLADWRNTIVMLLGGYLLSVIALWLTEPTVHIPREFLFAAAGSLLLVVGGTLSHQGQKRVELQRMRRVYSGLAGSIAHEMRNPLGQVRHSLDSIAAALSSAYTSEGARLAAPQVQAVLERVQQGRDAISRGLQAIDLTLQQLQPAPLEPGRIQSVQALACVQRALKVYAYQDEAQHAIVRLDPRGDFRFRGDTTALELVIFNLLKNALYYLPTHPDMTVTVTVTAEPSPRIVVRDTGPGIAVEQLPRLFDEFHTVGKAEGTGLGLAFCRRVMQALGGSIACRSVRGSFTEFTLNFPLLAADDNVAAPERVPASLAGRTVLVVDDQAVNRSAANALCTGFGLRVLEADHGQQALALLRAGTVPDAVLMDMSMPGLDGPQTTRALRALPGPAGRVPVIALTANDSVTARQDAAAAGMQEVLGKPVDGELLRPAGHRAHRGLPPHGPDGGPAARIADRHAPPGAGAARLHRRGQRRGHPHRPAHAGGRERRDRRPRAAPPAAAPLPRMAGIPPARGRGLDRRGAFAAGFDGGSLPAAVRRGGSGARRGSGSEPVRASVGIGRAAGATSAGLIPRGRARRARRPRSRTHQ